VAKLFLTHIYYSVSTREGIFIVFLNTFIIGLAQAIQKGMPKLTDLF